MNISIAIEYDTETRNMDATVQPQGAGRDRVLIYGIVDLFKEQIIARATDDFIRMKARVTPATGQDVQKLASKELLDRLKGEGGK